MFGRVSVLFWVVVCVLVCFGWVGFGFGCCFAMFAWLDVGFCGIGFGAGCFDWLIRFVVWMAVGLL